MASSTAQIMQSVGPEYIMVSYAGAWGMWDEEGDWKGQWARECGGRGGEGHQFGGSMREKGRGK